MQFLASGDKSHTEAPCYLDEDSDPDPMSTYAAVKISGQGPVIVRVGFRMLDVVSVDTAT